MSENWRNEDYRLIEQGGNSFTIGDLAGIFMLLVIIGLTINAIV